MMPFKRKRVSSDAEEASAVSANKSKSSSHGPTRRATRQTATMTPLLSSPVPEPRRRQRRTGARDTRPPESSEAGIPVAIAKGKENIPIQTTTRTLLQKPAQPIELGSNRSHASNATARTNHAVANTPSDLIPSTSAPARPPTRSSQMTRSGGSSTQSHRRTISRVSLAGLATPGRQGGTMQLPIKSSPKPLRMTKSGQSDRNIDKVVLGNICFRAWYPSYYGKEVLWDITTSSAKGGPAKLHVNGVSKGEAGGKGPGRRVDNQPMLDRLYVCPSCFKYSKELVTWREHVRVCESRDSIPGKKIYVHPRGTRTRLVDPLPSQKLLRGKRAHGGARMVEEIVHDEGEWSIWEVDGEKDVLFCQNLSLFAKLFLDNKSVFFDVTGFKYFLLVFTPKSSVPPLSTSDPLPSHAAFFASPLPASSQRRIVGFFSKEKMSWDNNNLACILIFPPWQRKGLGSFLMGVSYEISRREGVLGGPEKPISDLGKKGYKRYWAGEIARWVLGQQPSQAGAETVVSMEDCCEATWIAPDDCLLVLREMGVAQEYGKGPPRKQRAIVEEDVTDMGEIEVSRVRISKDTVRKYVEVNKISLAQSCDPKGFVKDYHVVPRAASKDV